MPPVNFTLYLVTDRRQTGGRPLVPLLREAIEAGPLAIQLREHDLDTGELLALAEEVLRAARARSAPVLINDRVDVALATEAAGIHLRANSLPVSVARKLLGPDRLVGVSTHSPEEAGRAEAEGADFVVLGPVYDTPSKRRYGVPIGVRAVEAACRRCRIPVFAIGGITAVRVREVRRAGAGGVAVVSAILAADDVARATRELLEAWRADA
jgi:thiamine-phosphate pyrophosphorylase